MNENLIVQEAERREKLTGFTELVSKSRVRSAYGIGFIEGAEWMSQQSQWINVEICLPNKDYNVFYTNNLSGALGVAYYIDGIWREAYRGDIIYGITHWCPIPPFNE